MATNQGVGGSYPSGRASCTRACDANRRPFSILLSGLAFLLPIATPPATVMLMCLQREAARMTALQILLNTAARWRCSFWCGQQILHFCAVGEFDLYQ